MSKAVSMDPRDAYVPKGGRQEFWGEITGAKAACVQFNANKKTGKQLPRLLALVLEIETHENEKGTPDGGDPEIKELVIEFGAVDDAGDLRPLRLQPGKCSPPDYEVEGLGDELGTEGNCTYSEDGLTPRADQPAVLFLKSLSDCGFKPTVLKNGYFPDLIGTRGHFVTKPGAQKRNSTDRYDDFVMDKITQYPYEKKAGVKTAAKGASAPATALVSAPRGKAPKAATNGSGDVTDLALQVLMGVASANSGATLTRQKLNTTSFMYLLKESGIEKPQHPAVQALIKNDEWLMEHAGDAGMEFDGMNAVVIG